VLRQLARLTRPLPAGASGALAVAVYSDALGRAVSAEESGFEGVACVDDAARLLGVLCDVWERTRQPWAERWARGLLEFVLWMQEPDGRWLNFVTDWNGARNTAGITSRGGENFWQARALMGVSLAWLTFGDERAERALHKGLEHAVGRRAPPDIRALHVMTGLRLMGAGRGGTLADVVREWCDELVACRDGDGVLKNSAYETVTPHLWGHVEEGVLADASATFEVTDYRDAAVRSAEQLIEPAIRQAFPAPGTAPYDVASCVFVCDRLHEVTGEAKWASLAADARAWFDGRNTARLPVYDRERGRVADGIDGTRISENSGAEANVVAAEALGEDVVRLAAAMEDPLAQPDPTG
jgi:hypothetical protein